MLSGRVMACDDGRGKEAVVGVVVRGNSSKCCVCDRNGGEESCY